jgi:hypothetical protein
MNSEAFREQRGPAELAVINFNNESYGSWAKARDAYRPVSRNARVNSVWKKVNTEPDDADADNKPFQLECKICNVNCQLKAPSKWKRDHQCKKTAPRSIGSVSLHGAQFFFSKFVARLLGTTVLNQRCMKSKPSFKADADRVLETWERRLKETGRSRPSCKLHM